MEKLTNSVYFLGIDVGTTSLKVGLYDPQGYQIALDRREYQLNTPGPALVELEPDIYWEALCSAVRQVIQQSTIDSEAVAGFSISSQGETLIPVDKDGFPTRDAIVWLDNRAAEEARLINTHFNIDDIYQTTGQPEVAPTWPACKILWIKRHEPDIFARTYKFLLLEDYLLYHLTGQYVTECGQQTSSLFLDISNQAWWEAMLDFIGLSVDQLGRLMEPGELVGPLSQQGAKSLGLTTKTMAVSGSMDQSVGAVGAGNILPGVVTEATGGALGILVTLEKPTFDPQRRVPCYHHALKNRYCLLPWGQTAGMALRWFRDQFYNLETLEAQESGLDPYDLMMMAARKVTPGSDGLTVLPHLEGAFCPEYNPAARAVFFGATLRHTRAHFVRAILESVAYMLKKNLDLVEGLGVPVKEIRSTGGGARSDLWLQIKADVLQKPIIKVESEETACLGAALMAAVATGYFSSPEAAVSQMVRIRDTLMPGQDFCQAYEQGYAKYLELYERLAPMFN